MFLFLKQQFLRFRTVATVGFLTFTMLLAIFTSGNASALVPACSGAWFPSFAPSTSAISHGLRINLTPSATYRFIQVVLPSSIFTNIVSATDTHGFAWTITGDTITGTYYGLTGYDYIYVNLVFDTTSLVDVTDTVLLTLDDDITGATAVTCTPSVTGALDSILPSFPIVPVLSSVVAGNNEVTLNYSESGFSDRLSYFRNGSFVGYLVPPYSGVFVDTGLTNGLSYTYYLTATTDVYFPSGESGASDSISVVPTAGSSSISKVQLVSIGLSGFIAFLIIKQFAWRGKD